MAKIVKEKDEDFVELFCSNCQCLAIHSKIGTQYVCENCGSLS